jgi:hypothetical protein
MKRLSRNSAKEIAAKTMSEASADRTHMSHRSAARPALPNSERIRRTGRFQGFSGIGPQKAMVLTVLQYGQDIGRDSAA